MSNSDPERTRGKETELEHGLTPDQISNLFGDQVKYPDGTVENNPQATIRVKVVLAVEWLCSFSKRTDPKFLEVLEEQASRHNGESEMDADAISKEYLSEAGIQNPNPIFQRVYGYFSNTSDTERGDITEHVCELILDAEESTNSEIKRRAKYVTSLLTAYKRALKKSQYGDLDALTQVNLPEPLS